MSKAKVLYLSYDGLTDQLGQSQVLPYLLGLSNKYDITLITFEKSNAYNKSKQKIANTIKDKLIWLPLNYSKNPPVLSTIYDLLKLKLIVKKLVKKQAFDIVHCRSYLVSIIGLWLKKKYRINFLFDMRGFWVDERVEGKIWNIKNIFYLNIFNYFKLKEKEFFLEADHIISLTSKAVKPILSITNHKINNEKISIIPCCADIKLFNSQSISRTHRVEIKKNAGFAADDLILLYVGSIGTWYMLNEMLDFYQLLVKNNCGFKLLIITRDNHNMITREAIDKGINTRNIFIKSATREEVVKYISISDLAYYFIHPTFSKQASSPTKLAEYMSLGKPIITNSNIGDISDVFKSIPNSIYLINSFNENEYEKAIRKIPDLLASSKKEIFSFARGYFSLESGIEKYDIVYQKLLS
ncbi:MAG: glycosyltransferase [Flavobacteriaceae bacterium]|nr:glycosyltransferase [Flavobacteriaceae bacterium]